MLKQIEIHLISYFKFSMNYSHDYVNLSEKHSLF